MPVWSTEFYSLASPKTSLIKGDDQLQVQKRIYA